MKEATISNAVQLLDASNCPDGVYDGVWGGYVINWEVAGNKYQGKTDVGLRGMDIACKVRVESGTFTVWTP